MFLSIFCSITCTMGNLKKINFYLKSAHQKNIFRETSHDDFHHVSQNIFLPYIHPQTSLKVFSMSINCIIITHWHSFQLRTFMHSSHCRSNNAMTKLWGIMFTHHRLTLFFISHLSHGRIFYVQNKMVPVLLLVSKFPSWPLV